MSFDFESILGKVFSDHLLHILCGEGVHLGDTLQCLEEVFVVTIGRYYWHLVGTGQYASKHFTMHRTAPCNKELSRETVNSERNPIFLNRRLFIPHSVRSRRFSGEAGGSYTLQTFLQYPQDSANLKNIIKELLYCIKF